MLHALGRFHAAEGSARRAGSDPRLLGGLAASASDDVCLAPHSQHAFLALTYGATRPSDPKAWKRDLDRFAQRLLRRWPHASAIWRMETQQRGAPHFHVIVLGARFIPWQWVKEARTHGMIEAKRVKSYRAAMAYVSKYVSKCQEHDFATPDGECLPSAGRLWGVVNRHALPARG